MVQRGSASPGWTDSGSSGSWEAWSVQTLMLWRGLDRFFTWTWGALIPRP